jgi:hypothetical protein
LILGFIKVTNGYVEKAEPKPCLCVYAEQRALTILGFLQGVLPKEACLGENLICPLFLMFRLFFFWAGFYISNFLCCILNTGRIILVLSIIKLSEANVPSTNPSSVLNFSLSVTLQSVNIAYSLVHMMSLRAVAAIYPDFYL